MLRELRFQTPKIAPDRGKKYIDLRAPWEDEGHGRSLLAGVHRDPNRMFEPVPKALQNARDGGAERIGPTRIEMLRGETRMSRGGQADDGIGFSKAEDDQFGEIASTRRSVSYGRDPRILWTPFFRLKR